MQVEGQEQVLPPFDAFSVSSEPYVLWEVGKSKRESAEALVASGRVDPESSLLRSK